MRILVSGTSGLVGTALVPALTANGHEVVRLVRSQTVSTPHTVLWNPLAGEIDKYALTGMQAVIHLAGENIAAGRWTNARKERIRSSRVKGTRLLCETLAGMAHRPEVLLCASATGFYGDRGDEMLDEESTFGTGFLAEVCREWEAATEPVRQVGMRVVHLRFGVILSPQGGALGKMLLPFRLGLGGRIGSGRQFMSWITLDDAVNALLHALAHANLQGPVNVVTANPVTNHEFTKTLAHVLWRPAIFPMPAFAARLAFGEMANELLLASTRVLPKRLQGTGFVFSFPELDGALRHLLAKPETVPGKAA